jgi:hypothetical protein
VGNGLGLQGAYGSAGMQQSLEELVAQRLKETLLQQQEADRAHQRQMSEGHLGLGERNIALDETRFGYQKNRDTARLTCSKPLKRERALIDDAST